MKRPILLLDAFVADLGNRSLRWRAWPRDLLPSKARGRALAAIAVNRSSAIAASCTPQIGLLIFPI